MNELIHIFAPLSAAATGALFSAMWQGAAMTGVVILCLRLLPGLSAGARSLIWLNLFLLAALLQVLPMFPHAQHDGDVPAIHLDPRWSLAVAGIWLAASAWRGAQLLIAASHLRRLTRNSVPVEVDAGLRAVLDNAPAGRRAELCTVAEIDRPSVLGFFRPRILVPPMLIEKLSAQELQQVILHEMEHLRRGDDWTNLLQKIGLVVFPLNPVLIWVERRLCAERELACDDRVVRSGAGRKAYALCLTRLAELSMLSRGLSLVLGAFGRRPELVRRVERVLSRPARSMGRRAALLTTGGVLAGAMGCAIVLAHSPQLVSFAPGDWPQEARAAGSFDLREMSRELGGRPQMVKAVMPTALQSHAKPLHRAVVRRALHRDPLPSQVGSMASGESRQARQALVVMTEWNGLESAPRVVVSTIRDEQSAPPVVVPASYVVVPTPNGWLILQI